ncbi:MAG: hypothetical protein K2X47_05510 [Bdellovibrionales bacterium]|nr:hypothetical protein [Bdellovibrionales bacterium]
MSQIKTTATVLAVGLGVGLFMFQNCAEQPVSAKRTKSASTNCSTLGDCYEEEETSTTTTSQRSTTTTTQSSGGGGGGSTSRAEITSVSMVQGSTSVPLGGYYAQNLKPRVIVSGKNITGVQWGTSGLRFNCLQIAGVSTCTSDEIILGVESAGTYGSLNVVAMNGSNTALSQTLAFASQCYVLLNECKFILLGAGLSQPADSNEVSVRGRALGAFIASGLMTASACNASQTQESARVLAAASSFNRNNANACIFFRAAFPSGNPSDYQCLYVGLDSAAPSAIYYNATHEVPCNSGLTLSQMGGVTTDMSAYVAYAGLIIRHKTSGRADVATMYANCMNGTCQISNVKQGNRPGTCAAGTGMCSF